VLKYFAIALALLVLVPSLLWGFPGLWALPALLPAFIIAATLRHARMPRAYEAPRPPAPAPATPPIRPAVVVLGGLFALVTGAVALVFMWAAAAPSTVVIGASTRIEAPRAEVWERVVDVRNRRAWSPWMADAEPIGRGGEIAIGSRFRAMLALDRHQVPAELEVVGLEPQVRFAWKVVPQGDAKLSHILENVTLTAEGERATRVSYELRYEVPTVLARVGERLAVRGSVERLAEATVEMLRQRVLALE
jgi:carbon monoxide dehydrogenase subunit G